MSFKGISKEALKRACGAVLSALLRESGTTQSAFANALKTYDSSISDYVRGKVFPNDKTRGEMARYWGLSLEDFDARIAKKAVEIEKILYDPDEKQVMQKLEQIEDDAKRGLYIGLWNHIKTRNESLMVSRKAKYSQEKREFMLKICAELDS